MTKLHFNYKDVFRALRIGFSAKKVWMMFMGLLVGFAGYTVMTYLAHIVSGNDFLTIWENFRLLPFPAPEVFPFQWYAWIVYVVGVVFFICASLLTGTAVSKIAYEQLRGDEFYESREAFRFAFRNSSAVLASPLLIIGFLAVIVICGLVLGLLGMIPVVGEVIVGLFALPAFVASFFIVYLIVVLFFSLLIGPSIVGATKNDAFDTIFEVFSCVNEQPARLVWYLATVAVLSQIGQWLFAAATSFAGRIGFAVVRPLAGVKLTDVAANAAFYFKVYLPDWLPAWLQDGFRFLVDLVGLPQIYATTDYFAISWHHDTASVLIGFALYVVALLVVAYGCSVWYSGVTLTYAVLAKKKDDRDILELPEDEEELTRPVVPPPHEQAAEVAGAGGASQATNEDAGK